MSSIEYDEADPPKWFRLKSIKYFLRDSVIINGEESNVYYALIAEIKRATNQVRVQWYYLPHEMVMSARERATIHPNEIFITMTSDWIELETILMKAAIFHTKGLAPPKKIPDQWMILRRKYDPYKNTIKSIDLVKDDLTKVDKLNISLCSRSSDSDCPPTKTPSRSTPANKGKNVSLIQSTDSEIEVKFSKKLNIFSSSDENTIIKGKGSSKLPAVTAPAPVASTKSTYFFLSSEDVQEMEHETSSIKPNTELSKRSYPSRRSNAPESSSKPTKTAQSESKPSGTSRKSEFRDTAATAANRRPGRPPKAKTPNPESVTPKPSQRRSRATKLSSELETLSLEKELTTTPRSNSTRSRTSTPVEKTPQTTRSGRNVKPVQSYHSLQKSLAIEALMKSNLLENTKSSESCSDSDHEVSFVKENKPPNKQTGKATPSSKRKKKKRTRYSTDSSDSSDDCETTKKKKKQVSKSVRTPLAPRRLKPAAPNTPCVVPMRGPDRGSETAFNVARSKLHVSAVPETLPCREEQFADIYYFVESKLEEKSGGCMYISGVPGTGKTATVRDVLRHIDDGDYDYQTIEINGMKLSDPKQLYSLIYRQLEGKKVTPDHGNLLLSEYFGKKEKKSIVLVVDELDLLWTRKQHVMYNLFDWPNRPDSKLVVIAIANTMDLPERMLMNKVASRLGLTRMTFQPYAHKQLLEIISSRLEGTTAFAPEACMLAARKVAAASGDARRALDICRHGIDVAELEGTPTVTSSHIQRAITNMYQSVKTKAIMSCTLYQKVFLKSVLGVFRRKGVEEAVFKEVYEVFSSLCQFQGLFAPPCGAILQLCVELGGTRLLLIEQGPPTLHTHIRLNCSQDDVVFALKEVA